MSEIHRYIRISMREQNESRQRNAMMEAGIPEQNLLLDNQSEKEFECLQLSELNYENGER